MSKTIRLSNQAEKDLKEIKDYENIKIQDLHGYQLNITEKQIIESSLKSYKYIIGLDKE